jgi:hypothetical protein
MRHFKINSTIGIYHLILITYAQLLIFPLIYKYQQLNLFKLHSKCQHFCEHYNSAESVLQIPCDKPTLQLVQMCLKFE